ncbi:MAG: hypothetical protein WCI62_05555, partial [Erysipelotrichaceae bacterium]
TPALSSRQRFIRALIVSIPTALVFVLAYGVLYAQFRIGISIAFILMGYGLGYVIQKAGRGVKQYFSIYGAILCAITFILCDLSSVLPIQYWLNPQLLSDGLQVVFTYYLKTDMNSLLDIAFRAYGVFLAYKYARVI